MKILSLTLLGLLNIVTISSTGDSDVCTEDCSYKKSNASDSQKEEEEENSDICWNPIMANVLDCDCEYECVDLTKNSETINDCLRICGFAIVRDAYNASTITNLYDRFFNTMTFDERDEYAGIPKHLRGNRIEYLVPAWDDMNLDEIIYNQFIVDTVMNFMKEEMDVDPECPIRFRKEPIIFDQLTIIWAPGTDDGGDVDQGFHDDSSFGIKMQIPMVNTNFVNGPVEIVPLKGICPIVKGIVSVGTVIIYQQQVYHRGSKNNDKNCRPVIDMSFMILSHHWRDSYIRQNFYQYQFVEMGKHQEIFIDRCNQSPTCPLSRQTIFVEDEM